MILCWLLKLSIRKRGILDALCPHSNSHINILSLHSSNLLYLSISISSSCTDFSLPLEQQHPPNNTACKLLTPNS